MQAVLEVKGKQYLVEPGTVIKVATLDQKEGDKITLDSVLMTIDGKKLELGKNSAKVAATVVAHGLDDKVMIYKHHAKKRYRRTAGHRQGYTEIKIESIEGSK